MSESTEPADTDVPAETGDPATPVTATVITPAPAPPVSVKVRIDAGGREVELETSDPTSTVDCLAAVVLALWRATSGAAHPVEGRGFGLVSSERAFERRPSSTMDWPVDPPR